MTPVLNLLVLILLGILSVVADSMRFDLRSGSTKCISEDIKSNAMTVGKYNVVNPMDGFPMPDTHKINVKVNSPHGNNFHDSKHAVSGYFAFTAAEGGDYSTCFWLPDHKPPITASIEFDWTTAFALKDWSKVAKKGQIEMMEFELKKMHDIVRSIHDEMFYLREREEEMQRLNRVTSSKMATFSFLSLAVCLLVSGLQLWHLKTFFERKKIL